MRRFSLHSVHPESRTLRVAYSSAPPAFWLGILIISFNYFLLIAPFDEVAERDGMSRGQPFSAGGRRQAQRQYSLAFLRTGAKLAPPQVEHDSVAQGSSQALYAGGRVCRRTFFLSRAYHYAFESPKRELFQEVAFKSDATFFRANLFLSFSAKWTVHAFRNFNRQRIHNLFFPDIKAVAFDFSFLPMTSKHHRHQYFRNTCVGGAGIRAQIASPEKISLWINYISLSNFLNENEKFWRKSEKHENSTTAFKIGKIH